MPLSRKKKPLIHKKIDEGRGSSSWPLPPASVFRCRQAEPWINPELFYYHGSSSSFSSSTSSSCTYSQGEELRRNSGIMFMGEAQSGCEQVTYDYTYEEESPDLYLKYDETYAEPIYADPVELTRSTDRIIEYSSNPEKAIDVDGLETAVKLLKQPSYLTEKRNSVKKNEKIECDWAVQKEEELNREALVKLRLEAGYGELGKMATEIDNTSSRLKQANRTRRKWLPFQKNQKESWKLFY